MRIDKNKCIYTAIFLDLDSETKERVTSLFKRDLPKKFLHHMTIEFRPTTKRAKPVVDQTGCETFVKVIGYEETDKIQVLVVEHGLGTVKGKPLVTSKVPHVTVATNANTSPVYANEVLEDGWTPLDEPIYLTGYIGALVIDFCSMVFADLRAPNTIRSHGRSKIRNARLQNKLKSTPRAFRHTQHRRLLSILS